MISGSQSNIMTDAKIQQLSRLCSSASASVWTRLLEVFSSCSALGLSYASITPVTVVSCFHNRLKIMGHLHVVCALLQVLCELCYYYQAQVKQVLNGLFHRRYSAECVECWPAINQQIHSDCRITSLVWNCVILRLLTMLTAQFQLVIGRGWRVTFTGFLHWPLEGAPPFENIGVLVVLLLWLAEFWRFQQMKMSAFTQI